MAAVKPRTTERPNPERPEGSVRKSASSGRPSSLLSDHGDQFKAMKAFFRTQQLDDPFRNYYAAEGVAGTQFTIRQPAYSFAALMRLLYENNILLSCVTSICTNCDGHGYRLEYVGPKGQEDLKEALQEKATFTDLLENPNDDQSYHDFMSRTRWDRWTVGNSFTEIIRDATGKICMFSHIPAYMMRTTGKERDPILVEVDIPRDGGKTTKQRVRKHFRRFVQVFGTQRVFFKEFGDPRPIDPTTGLVNPELDFADQATEVIHDMFYTPFSPYGIPPWVAQMPSVLGSRQAELTNLDFFNENAIPAMALLVSGGQVTQESVEDIEAHFLAAKGRASMHRVLMIEALGDQAGKAEDGALPIPRLEIKSLQGDRQNDQLFQVYDQNCRMKVRSSFRLPPILVGEASDYTYATAKTSFEVAESQVFGPERARSDRFINHVILGTYKPKFWAFRSNPPRMVDPADVVAAIVAFDRCGALTPNVAIGLANEYFDLEIAPVREKWGDVPMPLLLEFAMTGKLIGFEAVYEALDVNVNDPGGAGDSPDSGQDGSSPKAPAKKGDDQVLRVIRKSLNQFKSILIEAERSNARAR